MTAMVTLPLWLFVLILLFAVITFASHFLFPSVRWFLRRRMERVVARINTRLERPIQPFKLARRTDMIQRLCYDPEVAQAIVDHARETGVREDVAFEQAKAYAREIVPSFSATAYFGVAIRAARLLSNALFRVRLGHHDAEVLNVIDRDATVVFVMNHRSNMDYVLVTYLAADRSALSYAVGEWARVWPLSFLIKAMGAYFIRRKSRNALYRRVLARYVQMATRAGVTQAMFPEGGLSLDGALAPPRIGLLKYITNGVDLVARDVVFVPVALNYDRVFEDRILIAAGEAGTRRFRARISVVAGFALKQVWLWVTGRFHRFGYAAVSFGVPLSLRTEPQLVTDPDGLAQEIMQRIAVVVPVLPVPLVAYLLLERGPLDRAGLERAFGEALRLQKGAHVHLARHNRPYSVEVGLRALLERKMIEEVGGGYVAAQGQEVALRFYANSIRHLF
ncbi:1-acyl-sn-glycerol-3-phosphate acyltransferase [Puniceibacterium sp. IMCC21224]|uniref:1-acyl-sn-glycerol-3-phosphate acyltransferase n=1 Tax=Puniceibacterium sp. IMCC21224 TaxID=1618204 RepID=UPI00064DB56E|nr:1-acyl-sn-glycerol-3-phosphate acyltransferase [Puniceibacterium sp. IMCC21224]KMK66049.1 glycerol-3-phosphate acyltransferase [Puniceibacterium sp. IMCC21224]